ncbi:hypothetical protein Areg01_65970 [Actinoplanes regularis]|nr:hypothetical protein Areg01_65970 [Actinoplanes regularis]
MKASIRVPAPKIPYACRDVAAAAETLLPSPSTTDAVAVIRTAAEAVHLVVRALIRIPLRFIGTGRFRPARRKLGSRNGPGLESH